MAQSEAKKQIHKEALILANKTFPQYKQYIAKELFFSEFGVSYKTIQEFQESWRDIVIYNPKCEEFLKFKTKIFLHMLPIDNELYAHPRFLRILTRQICNYISRYIARKDKNLDRVAVADELYQELHTNNDFIQHKRDIFCAGQCAKQQQTQEEKGRKRQRINHVNAQPVHMSKQESRRLGTKSVNARLREKRQELGKQPVPFTSEQEARFQRQKATYRARKTLERTQIIISVSVNGIGR